MSWSRTKARHREVTGRLEHPSATRRRARRHPRCKEHRENRQGRRQRDGPLKSAPEPYHDANPPTCIWSDDAKYEGQRRKWRFLVAAPRESARV